MKIENSEVNHLIRDAHLRHKEFVQKQIAIKAEEVKEGILVEDGSYPDLICIYKPETDCDLVYSLESYDKALQCDICKKMGSYYMTNEKYKIGSCRSHIMDCNQYERIIEVPVDNEFPQAIAIEESVGIKYD